MLMKRYELKIPKQRHCRMFFITIKGKKRKKNKCIQQKPRNIRHKEINNNNFNTKSKQQQKIRQEKDVKKQKSNTAVF